ncbi:hypothetical protein DFR49_3874 [Hephaestia caeni]|uniref:Uncharacterized protein n=1 Tax=Hephaestia caeni TaxID=645617 RepID=A0A397NQK3_9SPHN|nr:hypothetical protein [Hephaestia caeni]RIA37983.1 hypothetical protein DFR49_3874 [Hephaestia caeni]
MFASLAKFAMMAGCLGLLAGAGIAAGHPADNAKAEAKLADALEGRVAGTPVDCIQLHNIRSSRIFNGTAILYDTGSTLYLNRPDSGATWLSDDDVLVTDTHSPQLCSIDTVRLFDNASHMPNGSVSLGKFVPYTKPKT